MNKKTVFDIANWFLSNNDNINNKKLQLLVYYTYCWSLIFFNEFEDRIDTKFFNAEFEAWIHGPVCVKLYNKYKKFGSSNIKKYNGPLKKFSEDELDLLKQINETYGDFSANDLLYICQRQDPWIKTRNNLSTFEPCNEVIKDSDIFKYFIRKLIFE